MIFFGQCVSVLFHLSSQMEQKGKSSGVNTKKSTWLLWLCLPSSEGAQHEHTYQEVSCTLRALLQEYRNSQHLSVSLKAFIKTNIFLLTCGISAVFQKSIRIYPKLLGGNSAPFMSQEKVYTTIISHLQPCFEGLSAILYTEMNFILQQFQVCC